MLDQLLAINAFGFFMVFSRVGATLAVIPGIGDPSVPMRARLFLALALALVTLPVVGGLLPPIPGTVAQMFLLFAGEFVIGLFLGVLARFLIAALQTAGTIIAYSSALANALVFDPVSQQQGAVIAGFLTLLGSVMLFVTDMHHILIRALVDSYTLFAPGALPPIGDMSALLSRTMADAFTLGVQLAAPFIVISFSFNLIMGLLSRLMPQLQVFFIGLPVQIGLFFITMTITISGIMLVFLTHFEDATKVFLAP